MFVIKNRDIKIVSKTSIDESRIVDIYTDEEGDECFDYEFFFDADLRVALNTKNIKVKISIRKVPKEKSVAFFSDLTDVSAYGVVNSLYTKDTDNKTKLRVNDRTGLIKRSFIDLSEYVPNFKLRNSKKLSDRALFGVVKKTQVFRVSDVLRKGVDMNLPQRNLVTKKETSSKRLIQNYQIAIKNGVDPSMLTSPIESMTKADPKTRGTFTKKRERVISDVLQGARDTSMKILEKGNKNPVSLTGMSLNDAVGLTVDVVDRVKIISKSLTIKKNSIVLEALTLIVLKAEQIKEVRTKVVTRSL